MYGIDTIFSDNSVLPLTLVLCKGNVFVALGYSSCRQRGYARASHYCDESSFYCAASQFYLEDSRRYPSGPELRESAVSHLDQRSKILIWNDRSSLWDPDV